MDDTRLQATQSAREQVAYFMRRLYRQGLTTTSGGNISVRCDDELVAITASQSDKGEQTAEQVGLVTLAGERLTPELKLSIETGMHLAIYRACPDVRAIVHAHPATASAFCASETPIDTRLTAENYALLGPAIPMVPYAIMGSEKLAELTAQYAQQAPCVLLKNHGVVATAATLLSAFDRLELVENAAQLTLAVAQLGKPVHLTADQQRELDRFMGR